MIHTRRRIVALFLGATLMSGGYLYAQFGAGVFEGFGALRGEQGDLAERPPQQ